MLYKVKDTIDFNSIKTFYFFKIAIVLKLNKSISKWNTVFLLVQNLFLFKDSVTINYIKTIRWENVQTKMHSLNVGFQESKWLIRKTIMLSLSILKNIRIVLFTTLTNRFDMILNSSPHIKHDTFIVNHIYISWIMTGHHPYVKANYFSIR